MPLLCPANLWENSLPTELLGVWGGSLWYDSLMDELLFQQKYWLNSYPPFCGSVLPPSCFPSHPIKIVFGLGINKKKKKKGFFNWDNFPHSVQLQQTWAGTTEWAEVRGKGQTMNKLSFLIERSAHQITALCFFFLLLKLFSFLQIAWNVWRQKEGTALQAGEQEKEKRCIKAFYLANQESRHLSAVVYFWGWEQWSGIPCPLLRTQGREKFTLSKKINVLIKIMVW